MRTFAIAVVLMLGVADVDARGHRGSSGTGSSPKSHSVRGYTTKRGTYVAPHRQTNPDHTQRNNYSSKGNVNPTTGKVGTRHATH